VICPNCQKEQKVTEQNYGTLFTCPTCQAVYFVNFDGQPEYGEMSEQVMNIEPETPQHTVLASSERTQIHDAATTIGHSNYNQNTNIEPMENVSFEPQEMAEPYAAYDSGLMNSFQTTPEEESPNPFQQTAKAVVAAVSSSNAFADIAQEISDFGNADTQLSSLNYDLYVSGIDTSETKFLFQEAIEDSKFAWDSVEIMKSIKGGKVVIHRISPVKAYLLAKRIQFLDIEKVWKQNVLS
jgi:uncharacterized Zn finger protein (UPF0148 family)